MIRELPIEKEMKKAMRESAKVHKSALNESLYLKGKDKHLYEFLCALHDIPEMVEDWGLIVGEAG